MAFKITRLVRFSVVGAVGVVVNMGLLILLTERLGLNYAIASLFAIELSILANFALNNAWTWSDRTSGTLGARLAKYHAVAGFTAITVNWCLLVLLTRFFGLDYRISNLIGIAAGMALNFILHHTWTFQADAAREGSIWPSLGKEGLKQSLRVRGISPRWHGTVAILLVLAVGWRVAAMAGMPLVPEEGYYWMYSQHPSLSYFDHPPMVAWLIWFGTQLFGHTEFGVRAGIALMMLASSAVMYLFGRIWFGREAAVVAAVMLQILPAYFGAGLIATMDSALVFFWLVCLLGVSVALQRQKAWGWYLAGVGLGGAILSKYTGILLGLGALLAVAGYPPWRRHLRSVHPYAASLLALAMFTPVLIWNEQHDWVSFRFQLVNRFAHTAFDGGLVATYALRQIEVATPFVLLGLGWFYARTLRKRQRLLTPRWWMALCFSLPLLLLMSYKSFRYKIHLSWTMQAYLCLLPAIAQMSLAAWRCARKKWSGLVWLNAALATVVVCLILDVLGMIYVVALQPRMALIGALSPWRQLAAAVQTVDDRLKAETGQQPLVIGMDEYRMAGMLAFYRQPLDSKVRASDFTTSMWILDGEGNAYPYWTKADQWIGRDCVLVSDQNNLGRFASRFKQFKVVDKFPTKRRTYYIGVGRGLRN